jgi:sugar phosphate isomerase/epimerase
VLPYFFGFCSALGYDSGYKKISKYIFMNRRTFLANTSIACAAAALPLQQLLALGKKKYPLGLQLFTINKDMNQDPLGSLKAVKALGYEDVEIYGFDASKLSFYGIAMADFRNALNDLELTASSGHFGFAPFLNKPEDALKAFTDQCIKGAHALGLKYITWPWMAPEQRTLENFKRLPQKLNSIAAQVKAAGLGFAYHNHDFEFKDYNGITGYDIILKETDPALVKLQMDLYWVMHSSKQSPKELVLQQPGRYVMWHIKDMDKVTRDYTELGNGSINYKEVLPNPATAGLEFYYLEQGGNFATNAMKSIADSAAYFKKHLQHLL